MNCLMFARLTISASFGSGGSANLGIIGFINWYYWYFGIIIGGSFLSTVGSPERMLEVTVTGPFTLIVYQRCKILRPQSPRFF